MKRDLQLFKSHRSLKWIVLGVLAAGFCLRLFLPQKGVSDVVGMARVIDGDSLVVAGREVRMQGIDAPEGRQSCRRGAPIGLAARRPGNC